MLFFVALSDAMQLRSSYKNIERNLLARRDAMLLLTWLALPIKRWSSARFRIPAGKPEQRKALAEAEEESRSLGSAWKPA